MSESSVTIVVVGPSKAKCKTLLNHLGKSFVSSNIEIVTNQKNLTDYSKQSRVLFIALISDKVADIFTTIDALGDSAHVIGFSNSEFDVVMGLEKGLLDVVCNANYKHLDLVVKRELSRVLNMSLVTSMTNTAHSDFTGVHSRLEFLECIQRLADDLHLNHSAILYVQLDNFAWINENLGMLAGDRFLKDIGQVLKNILHEDDFIARYQGGNFVIFVAADKEKLLNSKTDMIRETILELSSEYRDNMISSTASIGVRRFASDEAIIDLIGNAYDASDLARAGGGDAVHYYKEVRDDSSAMKTKKAWNQRIKEAFDKDLFVLYYQPIVSIKNDSTARYEVLLRMEDEDNNIISPGTFLPFAERAGLMSDIDRKVIVHSIEEGLKQQAAGKMPELFIKLSGKSVDDKNMPSWIAKTLKETGFPAEQIVFEITESIALHHMVQTRNLCSKIRSVGCKVALDHFGTRFRSFKLLDTLDVDYLKIDGSLVQHLLHNKGHQAIVKKIVKKSSRKNIPLIAESVQEAAYLPIIWQYNIDFVQGYFLDVPTESMNYDFRNLLI